MRLTTGTDVAPRSDLEQLTGKLPNATAHVCYEQPDSDRPADRIGTVDLDSVPLPEGTVAYLCGPLPFPRSVRARLLAKGVPADDVHYEVFGPDMWQAAD